MDSISGAPSLQACLQKTGRALGMRSNRARSILIALLSLMAFSGCASNRFARMRARPLNPLATSLDLDSRQGPRPTQRTMQMLRRNDLVKYLEEESPSEFVSRVQSLAYEEPTADNVYSIAEVAYIGAARLNDGGAIDRALDLYAASAVNAYFYLFDNNFRNGRNPYDPRFRRACDLYNNSLETALRYLQKQQRLKPGGVHSIQSGNQRFDFEVATRGTWQEKNFCDLRFVSDFKVQELKNTYRTFGLGVPLIAVYEKQTEDPASRYYPNGMSFPVTAFMRVVSSNSPDGSEVRHRCVIELRDTLSETDILVEGQRVPLEVDLTTTLAHTLDNPMFKQANVALQGLREPDKSLAESGLYMLEPYDPAKVPVVMVHGFWSSLVTWMEMFNDLRGSPEIRDNFQFWFYHYPTGGPFWFSGAHMRNELAELRQTLDPQRNAVALDQMVLVGHSMGGLLSKLQVTESGEDYWNLASNRALDQIKGSPTDLANLDYTFHFHANPSVQRVVTIATPFRGSNFSNHATQWLGEKLINLPELLVSTRNRLLRDNPGAFPQSGLIGITTSVQSLAPECQFLKTLEQKPMASWVKHHNIIGDLSEVAKVADGTDGVVKTESSHAPGATTEIVVSGDHINVHRSPRAILEVRRILLEHLAELRANLPPTTQQLRPTSYSAATIAK